MVWIKLCLYSGTPRLNNAYMLSRVFCSHFRDSKTIALFIMHGIKICVMSVVCKMICGLYMSVWGFCTCYLSPTVKYLAVIRGGLTEEPDKSLSYSSGCNLHNHSYLFLYSVKCLGSSRKCIVFVSSVTI